MPARTADRSCSGSRGSNHESRRLLCGIVHTSIALLESGNLEVILSATQPRVVIVGGGFGGLFATRELAGAPVSVTLIDKRNYHLFRPML